MSRVSLLFQKTTAITIAMALLLAVGMPAVARAVDCATVTAPSATAAKTVVAQEYTAWKQAYIVDAGNGQLRVQRSLNDSYDTVSEGIAYGMLFAAYSNDKVVFDGLWKYAKAHTNHNGLMNWRIAADGTTTGYNGATDADEDMAAALIAADSRWGNYALDAKKLIGLIKQHEVEDGTNILKPGDVWGGKTLMNPSYITPSYYDVFAQYSGDTSWNAVKTANNAVLQAIRANTDSKTTGYIPDWSQADGRRIGGMSYDYGYDGSRAPFRLAMASAWGCDATAGSVLSALNATNQKLNLATLASSYQLNGDTSGSGDGTPLLAAAASAAMVSDNAAYRAETWNTLLAARNRGYFGDAMRLLGLYVASGTLVNPLTLPATAPVVDTDFVPLAAKTYSFNAANVSAVSGTPVTVTATVIAPKTVTDALVDLELYDANGSRVKQVFFEQQTIGVNPKTYDLQFTPANAGTYTLKGGIFGAGWATNYTWNGDAGRVTVTNPTPVVNTPTPVVVPVLVPVVDTPQPVTPTPEVAIAPVVIVPTPVVIPVVAPVVPVVVEPTLAVPAIVPVAQPVVVTPTPVVVAPVITPVLSNISIWWPSNGSSVRGVQPFKAVADAMSVDNYDMYWQVDGGTLNKMDSSMVDAPHKEVLVDVSGWNWQPRSGKYIINFVAKNTSGSVLAQKSTQITVVAR